MLLRLRCSLLISIFTMQGEEWKLPEAVNCFQFYMILKGTIKAYVCVRVTVVNTRLTTESAQTSNSKNAFVSITASCVNRKWRAHFGKLNIERT